MASIFKSRRKLRKEWSGSNVEQSTGSTFDDAYDDLNAGLKKEGNFSNRDANRYARANLDSVINEDPEPWAKSV